MVDEAQPIMRARVPLVALMILNFNGLGWLKICLPSVAKSTYQNLDAYVIDNGSTDGSSEFVKSNYPHMKLVRFNENLGFAEAYNIAIKRVQADYVLLLNNDTVVLTPDWIEALVDRAERSSSIAAVACKLVSMQDHQRLDSVGGVGIKYWRGFVDIGRYETDRGQYDQPPLNPFSACGAAMLVRRSAFERVGGFDSAFYMYLEDADLCWRLWLVGYEIVYEPLAKIAHYFSGTTGQRWIDPGRLYLSHRNLLRAILKNCQTSLWWAVRNYLVLSFIVAAGYSFLEPEKVVPIVKAIVWNLSNLKDTYARRLSLQTIISKDEMLVLSRMYPRVSTHQPPEHSGLRHTLDILFEYSQFPLQSD
jgi:GT2 family glycosyltransferase